jgi:hypothetical protein
MILHLAADYRRLKRETEVRPIGVSILLALETGELPMASQMIGACDQHDHLAASRELARTGAVRLRVMSRYDTEASLAQEEQLVGHICIPRASIISSISKRLQSLNARNPEKVCAFH